MEGRIGWAGEETPQGSGFPLAPDLEQFTEPCSNAKAPLGLCSLLHVFVQITSFFFYVKYAQREDPCVGFHQSSWAKLSCQSTHWPGAHPWFSPQEWNALCSSMGDIWLESQISRNWETEPSYFVDGNGRWKSHLTVKFWEFLKHVFLNTCLSCNLLILFLGTNLREIRMYVYTKICNECSQ